MEDLQLVIFVLGAIAIVAVMVHGFWSIRKQQPKSLKDSPMGNFYKKQADKGEVNAKRVDAEGFDADGIGAVRVRKAAELNETAQDTQTPYIKTEANPYIKQQPLKHPGEKAADLPDFTLQSASMTVKEQHRGLKVSRQEPVANANNAPLGQSHAAIVAAAQSEPSSVLQSSSATQAEQLAAEQHIPQQTALFGDEVDDNEVFSAPVKAPTATVSQTETSAQSAVDSELAEPRDVLVLHVVAKDGMQLNGAELLPCFLSLNFKYGDMNIFHRHVDNAGNGKVLFSVANMLKPGVFDPDNMEQFTTQGVVFFMTLPCYGDALMNFSIMLNSARQLADDIDALVLDGQRQPWGDFTKQDYLQRIRANA